MVKHVFVLRLSHLRYHLAGQGLALGVTTRPPNELTTLPATADEAQLARTAEGSMEEFGKTPALSDI